MSVFKKGDRVFHPSTGWGVVKDFINNFTGDPMVYVSAPGKDDRWVFRSELSFTEYTIEMKGFSQERPGDKKDTMLCVIEQFILDLYPYTREVYCLINKSDYLSIVSSVISRRGIMGLGEDGFSNDYKDFTYNDERYTVHFMCSGFVKSGEFKVLKVVHK